MTPEDALYREIVDELVSKCRSGSGQIAAEKVRNGYWNRNAGLDDYRESSEPNWVRARALNALFEGLSPIEREALAEAFAEQFQSGVFDTLEVLYTRGVAPLDRGYEGDPFHDFVGRLDEWEWPEGTERWGALN